MSAINTLQDINVPAGNGQAGKAHDSRVKILSSSPDKRNLLHKSALVVLPCLVSRKSCPTVKNSKCLVQVNLNSVLK